MSPRDGARAVFQTFAVVSAMYSLGCSASEEFGLAEVTGRVTVDGKPVKNAVVVFTPEVSGDSAVAGPSSRGVTDEDGRFRLRTMVGSADYGAVVGEHSVRVKGSESDFSGIPQEARPTVSIPPAHRDSFPVEVPPEGIYDLPLDY